MRGMRFQVADAEGKWTVSALAYVISGAVTQKRRLGIVLGQGCREVSREHLLAQKLAIRCVSLLYQKVVIIT